MSELIGYRPPELMQGKWEAAADETAKVKVRAWNLVWEVIASLDTPTVSGVDLVAVLVNHPVIKRGREKYEACIGDSEVRKRFIPVHPDTYLNSLGAIPGQRKEAMALSILSLIEANPPLRRVA